MYVQLLVLIHSMAGYMQLSNPQTALLPSCFQLDLLKEEQYAKHLIGNAFSVPVIDFLLRSLQCKFANKKYINYDYQFAWQPKAASKTG
jgi:hypothetical protein